MDEPSSKCVNVQHQRTHCDNPTNPPRQTHSAPSPTQPAQPYPRDHSAYSSQHPYIIAPLEAPTSLGITLEHANNMAKRRRTNGYIKDSDIFSVYISAVLNRRTV